MKPFPPSGSPRRLRPLPVAAVVVVAVLAGCAQLPSGPRVAVMPPPGKPLEVFSAEDQACRAYAQQSIGTSAEDASKQSFVNSAVLGTVIGAAAGALGSASSRGAGNGAAVGLVAGSAIGANESRYAGNQMQWRYDVAYQQCMYTKGNLLPGQTARAYHNPPAPAYVPPPPPAPAYVPPPPPGSPPPPPPGVEPAQ